MAKNKETKLARFPSAIATTVGWVDPAKGELLVSIRGLSGARVWDRKTNTFDPPLDAPKVKKVKAVQADPDPEITAVEEQTPVTEETVPVVETQDPVAEETKVIEKKPAKTKKTATKKASKKTSTKE